MKLCRRHYRASLAAAPARKGRMARSRRIALVAVLSAWILATGVQWDFLQVVGWGRMIYTYSTELNMSVVEAVRYTFSGDARCRICEVVAEGKKTSENDPVSSSVPGSPVAGKDVPGKFLPALFPAPLSAPGVSMAAAWFDAVALEPCSPAYPVPLPPPRA